MGIHSCSGCGVNACKSDGGDSAYEGNIPLPELPPTLMDPADNYEPLVW